MSQNGKLIIETANVLFDEEYTRKHANSFSGPHIMLAITDTGIGMDEMTKSRLFEPFFTTKEKGKGTGLGLAMVYGIIKQSGGNIWVYSEPGRGTTFKIYLPHVDEKPAERIKRKEEATRGKGELVLVVEDDPLLRELFSRMIKNLGYSVKVSANGEDAFKIVENGLRPVIIITDVVMPGMGGKQLVQRLEQIVPRIKVLYTSGYTDNAIVHHGVLDPQTVFLQKPFNLDDLAVKIREVMDSM